MRRNDLLLTVRKILFFLICLVIIHIFSQEILANCYPHDGDCPSWLVECGMYDVDFHRCCDNACDDGQCLDHNCICHPSCANCMDCTHCCGSWSCCGDGIECRSCSPIPPYGYCDMQRDRPGCDFTPTPTPIGCSCNYTTGRCNGSIMTGCQYGVDLLAGSCDGQSPGNNCSAPNENALLGDRCDSDPCSATGNYYCGYSASCAQPPTPPGGGRTCDVNNPYCAVTPFPIDCAYDASGCNVCGYGRVAAIWCDLTGGGTYTHCGDNCIYDSQCSTNPPNPWCEDGGGGPTRTPTPAGPTLTSTPMLTPTPTCTCSSWSQINVNGCDSYARYSSSPRYASCYVIASSVILNIASSTCATRFQLANTVIDTACADVNDDDFGTFYTYTPGSYSWNLLGGYGERKVCMRVSRVGGGSGKCGGMAEVVTPTLTATPILTITPIPTITITLTPVPGACTTSNLTPAAGACLGPTTQPGFHADYGITANEIQFAVDNSLVDPANCSNPFDGSWSCNSGWITLTSYGYPSCSLTTGNYYWSPRARSTLGNCTTSCFSPQRFFSIDKTAPTPATRPTGSLSAGNINFAWPASIDAGCGFCSGAACRYWLQGQWLPYGNPTPTWFVNNYTDYILPPDDPTPAYGGLSCTARAGYTARLLIRQARDHVYNMTTDVGETWALAGTYQCPTPMPYPTIHLSGNLREYYASGCQTGVAGSAVTVNLNPADSSGITTVCGVTPGALGFDSFACNVSFLVDPQTTPAQNFSLSALTDGPYSNVYSASTGNCAAPANPTPTLYLDVGSPGSQTRDILFDSGSASNPWFKLRDGCFSRSGALDNPIVLNTNPFDADDPGNRYLIDNGAGNEAGVASADSFALGGDTGDLVSAKNWFTTSYSSVKPLFTTQFLSYIKSRKAYTEAASASDLEADDTHTNIISGLIINSGNAATILNKIADTSSMVVVVDGDLIINQGEDSDNRFNKDKKTIAFVVNGNISIARNMIEVNGIYIGTTVDVSSGGTGDALKITGNLISGSLASNLSARQRTDGDNSRPSFFVVFDPSMYLKLLPYLSVRNYEWEELR